MTRLERHMYFVYIMANSTNSTVYTGMTNDLVRRVYEHRTHAVQGFTDKYNVEKLVYYEATSDVVSAIEREKQIKKFRREKKNNLVNSTNPKWRDLYDEIV